MRCARVAIQSISAYEAVRSRVLEHPQIGTPARAATRKLAFPRFPYSLIYRLAEDDIVIVAIAHHHRRPGYRGKR
jgi:toxin ParE1/3/4